MTFAPDLRPRKQDNIIIIGYKVGCPIEVTDLSLALQEIHIGF